MSELRAFSGSIPVVYDTCLGPLLFEVPARDLAERVAGALGTGPLLELACGTGIATELLRERLPIDVEIVATDLNPDMLDLARERRGSLPNVRYEQADAQALPYDARRFGGVVCQFGIMFFPDLREAFREMLRVVRPGALVVCNAWDTLEANPAIGLARDTIARHFDGEAPSFLEIPFGSCKAEPTLDLLRELGFGELRADTVEFTVERPSAGEVALGLVAGNPGIFEILERANAEPEAITRAVAQELIRAFGPEPLHIPLRELVFTARAPGLSQLPEPSPRAPAGG